MNNAPPPVVDTPLRRSQFERVTEDNVLCGVRGKILMFIRQNVENKGLFPTIREIKLAVDRSSTSTIHTHLGVLEKYGFLQSNHPRPGWRLAERLDPRPLWALLREWRDIAGQTHPELASRTQALLEQTGAA